MKLFKRLLVLIFLILIVAVFARNIIVKIGARHAVKNVTGLPLSIGGLNIGLKNPTIDIDDLRLQNPESFIDKTMVDVPDIDVDYNPQEFIKGNIHFNRVKVHLSEFLIVKNGDGKLNIAALKPVKRAKRQDPSASGSGDRTLVIEKLLLQVDRVVYKDYSAGLEPKVKTFNVNINEEFEGVRNLETIVKLVLNRVLREASLEDLLEVGLDELSRGLEGILDNSTKLAVEKIKDAIQITDTVTEEAGDLFKDKARQMKKLFDQNK